MSMIYCDECDKHIDTDFNAEHFDDHCSCGAKHETIDGVYDCTDTCYATQLQQLKPAPKSSKRSLNRRDV